MNSFQVQNLLSSDGKNRMDRQLIRLFSTDLDGTLLGNPESTRRFRDSWKKSGEENRPILCYNTGRSVKDTESLIKRTGLARPDYIIAGVGTHIWNYQKQTELYEFHDSFGQGWDLEKIEAILKNFPGVSRQPPEFLHPYKSSWYLLQARQESIDQLKQQLVEAGLDVHVIYSSMRDLDVLPSNANKGNALNWLAQHLNIPIHQVAVAGDSGNDGSMFQLPGVHGIVVENAMPELYETTVELPVFCASKIMADGVLEGLEHLGVISEPPDYEDIHAQPGDIEPTIWRLLSKDAMTVLNEEEKNLIQLGYEKALEAVPKNITPLGFSACSLTDNVITGTDANYHSVWARDGAITLVSTIDVSDPDIRKAQRDTLRTLFDNITPNGQIPANVRIADGVPDYSGVGGICSIDSGIWAIIAFYHYVQKTEDTGFLEEYSEKLHLVMNWLRALDSNNDGLLEIPEAGDWTDLFGRSYHVLYDEVLWYRANVCFGRLLEFQHDFKRATDFLRWSQFIRSKILTSFWPTTNPEEASHPITFADRQHSLGDASYLLAEITPFAFNWRCDVLGNILAFLTNVLDAERARVAFKFMWGVGVNEPGPVSNLYPAVQSGDPDWRTYYTVNLLNLPHHYHNGGIWPFIGGMWVRFIHRLGLHDVACRELYRLAKTNQQGKVHDWEFNEWVHGQTGRPMGKCYQAWSAASFIRACQELQMNPESLADD